MRCAEDPEPGTFGERLRALLAAEPIFTNVIATVLASPPEPGGTGTRWLRVHDGDELAGAAIWTPGRGVLLSPMPPPGARALADHLVDGGDRPPSVDGPARAATAFARRFATRTGGEAALGMAQRLYRLDRVIAPTGVPGAPRPATVVDRALILDWLAAFSAEAVGHHPGEAVHRHPGEGDGPAVDRRLATGWQMWFWEVDGEPVTFCWCTPVSSEVRVSRVGMVYTPPARRGHGYASANVAAASRHALTAGATACVLYTDLANPISNRIYQAIGYRPVGDAQQWWLS